MRLTKRSNDEDVDSALIIRLKTEKRHWGARKIRELLVRRLDGDIRIPAKSTIHAVLDRPRPGQARRRSATTDPPDKIGHYSGCNRPRHRLGGAPDSTLGMAESKFA